MTIKLSENVTWTDETCSSRYGIGCINDGTQDYGPKDVFPWDEVIIKHDTVTGKDLPADQYRSRTICEWVMDWWTTNGFHSESYRPTPESIKILRRWQRIHSSHEFLEAKLCYLAHQFAVRCPHCGREIETQQKRAAESRWSSMTKAERAAEMSRVRKIGVKRAKTKHAPVRPNEKAHRSAPAADVERKERHE